MYRWVYQCACSLPPPCLLARRSRTVWGGTHTHTHTHKSTHTITYTHNTKIYFKPCRQIKELFCLFARTSALRVALLLRALSSHVHCARRDTHTRTQTQAHTLKHNHKYLHPNCYGTRGSPGIKRKLGVVYSISARMGALPCFLRASSGPLFSPRARCLLFQLYSAVYWETPSLVTHVTCIRVISQVNEPDDS